MIEALPQSPEVDKIDSDFTLRYTTDPSSKMWQDVEEIEFEVFMHAGYVASPKELQQEYASYVSETTIVGLYREDNIIGEIRIINYNPELGFKTTNDIQEGRLNVTPEGQGLLDGIDLNAAFEVGTIGLKQDYRSKPGDEVHAITQLYGMIYAYGLDNDKTLVLASYDEQYLERYSGLYGASLTRLGPAKMHMGSPTVPVLVNLEHMRQYFQSSGLGEFEETLLVAGRSVVQDD